VYSCAPVWSHITPSEIYNVLLNWEVECASAQMRHIMCMNLLSRPETISQRLQWVGPAISLKRDYSRMGGRKGVAETLFIFTTDTFSL
jgi:hypothetical protein